jgi:hypothetical protein
MLRNVVSALSVKKQVFQIILTVDNTKHVFVVLSTFATHLTNDLNPRSPAYSKLHVCYKKKSKKARLFVVSHAANQSNFSY